MAQHITKDEWICYFSGEIAPQEKIRLLQHVSKCPTCRGIMEKGNDLRYFLQVDQAGAYNTVAEEDEYRAVAGPGVKIDSKRQSGLISVLIRSQDNGLFFDMDTIESEGIGNKYALNLTDSGLTDDEKLLSLMLDSDNKLHILFHDPGVSASIAFITDGDFYSPEPLDNEKVFPLHIHSFCQVELSFSK